MKTKRAIELNQWKPVTMGGWKEALSKATLGPRISLGQAGMCQRYKVGHSACARLIGVVKHRKVN